MVEALELKSEYMLWRTDLKTAGIATGSRSRDERSGGGYGEYTEEELM